MQPLSINSNQGSQAYGSDLDGAFLLNSIVSATVVEKIDENLYLLQIGNNQVEAKISADLQIGNEYQFIVEKNGTPPELALLNQEPQGRLDSGLTPEEHQWTLRLAEGLGEEADQISLKALLEFVRKLGYDVNQDVKEVLKSIQPILALMAKIDAANPMIRQLMGQTLLFNMNANSSSLKGLTSEQWIEQVIRLSGEIPKWSQTETEQLIALKTAIEASGSESQKNFKAGLLGTNSKQQLLLEKKLTELLKSQFSPKEQNPELIKKAVQDILNSPIKRFFLASEPHQLENNNFLPRLEKNEAIQAFQKQAPGLNSKSTSSLLEHFSNLGGRLEKLNIGDVVSSQLAWKGGTPSAMQLHRTGTVLHMVQDLPPDQRNIARSDLIGDAQNKTLPVILEKSFVSDPASSSIAISKMKDFSQQSSLPNSYHVDKLLQNWTQSGGSLSELRPYVDSIQSWNKLIEQHPEIRPHLAEQLLKSPIFQKLFNANQSENATLTITKETTASLNQALSDSGMKLDEIPNKELKAVQAVLQEIAGPGQNPSPALVFMASWMMSKGIEITTNSLSSVMAFYQGHDNLTHLTQGLQDLIDNIDKLPEPLKEAGKALLHQLGEGGTQLKDVLSYYQKGNGQNLKMWLDQVYDFVQSQNSRDTQLSQQLQLLSQRIQAQEHFLTGLKHYNIQALRHDTPQLFELPFSFGGEIQHAFLKVYRRQKGSDYQNPEQNFKVVIDLDLDGLGKVRSEISLFNKHLQLDFISPEQNALKVLKSKSGLLSERLDANHLNASVGFKLKAVDPDPFSPEPKSQAAPKGKTKIDLSA